MIPYLLPTEESQFGITVKCPLCGRSAGVDAPDHHTSPGMVTTSHFTEEGANCPFAGAAVTHEAAFRRDAKLNPQEKRVRDFMQRQEMSCKGYDRITGEECHHPICDVRRQQK